MLIGNAKIGSLSIKDNSFDTDALNYLAAVEDADGQALENSVRVAINNFVVGCKIDGIWDAIVASCIMAGARTVEGAIIPLKGNAPTNNNFVAGDYSRTLGLLGNGSDKYLATGYNNNDTTNFPQNDSHISCYVSASQTDSGGIFVGTSRTVGSLFHIGYSTITSIAFKNRSISERVVGNAPIGFQASTRNNSANFFSRATSSGGISDATTTVTSVTPRDAFIGVFCGFGPGTAIAEQFSAARMSFYSIGKSLTIANLDTRVTTLMTTLNALL